MAIPIDPTSLTSNSGSSETAVAKRQRWRGSKRQKSVNQLVFHWSATTFWIDPFNTTTSNKENPETATSGFRSSACWQAISTRLLNQTVRNPLIAVFWSKERIAKHCYFQQQRVSDSTKLFLWERGSYHQSQHCCDIHKYLVRQAPCLIHQRHHLGTLLV